MSITKMSQFSDMLAVKLDFGGHIKMLNSYKY